MDDDDDDDDDDELMSIAGGVPFWFDALRLVTTCTENGGESEAQIVKSTQPLSRTSISLMAWGEHERRNGMLIALHLVKEDAHPRNRRRRRRRRRRRLEEGEN